MNEEISLPQNWKMLWRVVASILCAYALLAIGNAANNTRTSLDLIEFGSSVNIAGIVQSAYYAGFFCGGFFCSFLISRNGHHKTFATFSSMICVAVLIQSLIHAPFLWAFVRFMNGFAIVGIFAIVESWLNAAVSNEKRGQLFALYMIISYLSASAGQWLLLLPFKSSDWQLVMIAILCSLSIIPVSTSQQKAIKTRKIRPRKAIRRALKTIKELSNQAPLVFYGMIIAGILNTAFYTMMPIVLKGIDYDANEISGFMGLALLAAPLLQLPMGKIADQTKSRAKLLLINTSIVLLISFALIFFVKTRALLPLSFVYVAISFTFYGTLATIANDKTRAENRVELSAAMLMLFAFGGVLGPLLGSTLMGFLKNNGYYVFSFIVCAFLMALCAFSLREEVKLKRLEN